MRAVFVTFILGLTLASALLSAPRTPTSSSALHATVRQVKDGMAMRPLPHTDMLVSQLALGTMMFGDQTDQPTAFALLDKATKEFGINFIDTAESYPCPSAPSSSGSSEKIVGRWLASNRGLRQQLVVSTSVSGFSAQMTWLRGGGDGTRLSEGQIRAAVDGSLARLGTDYIDVLQLHWPDRYVPMLGAPVYSPSLERAEAESIESQLRVMAALVKEGKIRAFGLANETPYGVGCFSTAARLLSLPRPCLSQSAYNLLARTDVEGGMLEACAAVNGDMAIVAASPLAGGALTGKYLDARLVAPGDRMRRFVGFMHRYLSEPAAVATQLYKAAADDISLPLAAVALAFVTSRPFISSTAIGASSVSQLEEAVLALNVPISPEVEAAIDEIHRVHRDPSKGVFEVRDPNMEYTDPSKLPWGGKDQDVDPELDILINQRLMKF